jgi:hypothetical protein
LEPLKKMLSDLISALFENEGSINRLIQYKINEKNKSPIVTISLGIVKTTYMQEINNFNPPSETGSCSLQKRLNLRHQKK